MLPVHTVSRVAICVPYSSPLVSPRVHENLQGYVFRRVDCVKFFADGGPALKTNQRGELLWTLR